MARRQPTLAQQLGIGNDPVQPAPFSRANLQLRPSAIRGGGWTPAVPGTLSASETTLGRLAGALAQGGGLIGQIADLKAKKAELEERGLAITHQTAMTHMEGQIANEKIKQLSMSLDMAEQTTNEAIVNKQWSDASPEQWNEMVRENDRAVTESKEAAGKALGAVAEENAGMPLSALPPENRAVHHELKRGTAAASLLDAALKKHLLDWATETGEKGEFITKGSEDFDERVFAFIKQHKAANEILEGTPADNNYNLSLRTYFNNVLPALKEDFLEAHKKADLNNQIRQAAATLQTIPEADGTTPPLPVAGLDPGGTVLPPKNAQQEYIQSNQWAEIRGKNNDEFDLFMQNTLMALIGEKTYEAIKAGYNLLDMADADPDFKGYRGGKFGGSNHYNALKALLDAAEENLDTGAVKRADAKQAAWVEKLHPKLLAHYYDQNGNFTQGSEGIVALQLDVANGVATTLIKLAGRETELGRDLANANEDEIRRLNDTVISLIPSMQQNAKMGTNRLTDSLLGEAIFNFAQKGQEDLNIILDALPNSPEHDNLQKQFNNSGLTLGEFDITKKTADALRESKLKPHEIHQANFATEADAKGMRLTMAQRVIEEFINDPANPKGLLPEKDELRRLMVEEQQALHRAWPVIWAKHANVILERNAHNAAMLETELQAEHAEEQMAKLEEDKREEREAEKAWDLVKLARPLEEQDEKRLEGLTPGTPDFDIEAKKLSKDQRKRSGLFQRRWEHEQKMMQVVETSARKDVTDPMTEAHTGWGTLDRNTLYGKEGDTVYLFPETRLKKKEKAMELQKSHAKAFIDLLGYGMEYDKVLSIIKTGSLKGKEHGIGFIVATHEESTSDKDFNEWREKPQDEVAKAFLERKPLTPRTHETLSARADTFIAADTFSVVLPPITNLPINGAVRTATGKVESIDLPAIRAALEASDSDLYALTKTYGFAQEPAADPSLVGPPERPSAAEKEKSIIKFLTHQYNTPYLRSKFSISK